MRITILHSDISETADLDEQETLLQVATIETVLKESGHLVQRLAFTTDPNLFTKSIEDQQPDVVFNLVESVNGKSDQLHLPPLFLHERKLSYTGNQADTLKLSTDKMLTKNQLNAMRIATPICWHENELSAVDLDEAPFIVKSLLEDGSLGIEQTSIVNDDISIHKIIQDRKNRFGGTWFIEKYISGREFNISILQTPTGFQILPIAEISFANLSPHLFPIVDYAGKWHVESESYQGSERQFQFSPEDAPLLQALECISLQCAHVFNITGYARVDIRVDENNQPWVLEINANPSLAPDAGFAQSALQAGLTYSRLMQHLLMQALSGRGK